MLKAYCMFVRQFVCAGICLYVRAEKGWHCMHTIFVNLPHPPLHLCVLGDECIEETTSVRACWGVRVCV